MCCLETYSNALKLGVRDYVGELEFTNEDVESRGMEFPAVCTTELGEWWEAWIKHQGWAPIVIGRFAVSRTDRSPS